MAKGLEVRVVKLEDSFKFVKDTLSEMSQRVTGMDHVIRGNGVPGLVADVKAQNERIKTLEKGQKGWKDFAALCLSGGIVGFVVTMIQHFWK